MILFNYTKETEEFPIEMILCNLIWPRSKLPSDSLSVSKQCQKFSWKISHAYPNFASSSIGFNFTSSLPHLQARI